MAKRPALGRGLQSLIVKNSVSASAPPPQDAVPAQTPAPPAGAPAKLSMAKIDASPWQPRTEFDQERLHELAESLRHQGLVQPVIVRKKGERYELIAGERRYRAATLLEWTELPAVIMEASNEQMRELALVENLQRDDLNPIETARAYKALQTDLRLTHEDIADRIGVSRSVVSNAVRLLDLPQEVQDFVAAGDLSAGHGRLLLSLPDPLSQIRLSRKVAENGLSVRALESLIQSRGKKRSSTPAKEKGPDVRNLEERLKRHLNTKVSIEDKRGRGRIVIEYYSHDEIPGLLQRFGMKDDLD